MIKLFEKLAYKHNLWTVYSDFLEMAAISLSNSVDFINRSKREKRYMDIIAGYSKEEESIFPQLFGELVMALEEETTDVLGEIFMELQLGNKWKGQFFTPIHVSKAMGALSLQNIDTVIKEKGFITVLEPAAGGGSTIIGLALALKEKGFNYQKDMVVTAVDLDVKAVHMCYVQLSILGIPAVVMHGNTLSMEMFEEWKTPFYILHGWQFKKQKEPKPIELKVKEDGQMIMF
jgi:type I restriction-modification system DNA methylase subunit